MVRTRRMRRLAGHETGPLLGRLACRIAVSPRRRERGSPGRRRSGDGAARSHGVPADRARRGTNRLPAEFLTRLIWRESSFRAGAVSPAGARGIAQFMPGTAQERGLADPFDPEQAIPKAAHLLADLRRRFGNLGIAAAAYNAGPARVGDWLRGGGIAGRNPRLCPVCDETGGRGMDRVGRRCPRQRLGTTPLQQYRGSNAAGAEEDKTAEPAAESCLAALADLRRGGGGGGEGRGVRARSRPGAYSSPEISRRRSRWPRSSAPASAMAGSSGPCGR